MKITNLLFLGSILISFYGCYSSPQVCYPVGNGECGHITGTYGAYPKEILDHDLLTTLSDKETAEIAKMKEHLENDYALNSETSNKVAKTLFDWHKLGLNRPNNMRTEKDINDFSLRLYGHESNEIYSAILNAKNGSNEKLNEIVEDVASSWNITSESMREILNDFHSKDLKNLGLVF